MLTLNEITMQDREWVTSLMRAANLRGSEYTFSNLFNWANTYTMRLGRCADMLIVRSGATSHHYLYPVGPGDFAAAMQAIDEAAKAEGKPLIVYSIPTEGVDKIEALYPGRFEFKAIRDNFDYIYTRESLATLAGKKLHGKRNHINRFVETYPDWRYETLTRENLDDAWQMNVEWCRINGCHESHSLQREACAVRSAFEHYFELELTGGLLRAGGQVVAFCFGSPSADDTFVVHVEKAFSDVQGAYPMINQQFVQNELQNYTYVNREDDVGDEGLRKAKESYRPEMMYERYTAQEK